MKLHYYPETDSLYIDLSHQISDESVEVAEHVVLDLDQSGQITGIDIQHASERVDLSGVAILGIPGSIPSAPRTSADSVAVESLRHRPAR